MPYAKRFDNILIISIAVLLCSVGCLLRPGERSDRLTYNLPVKLTIAVNSDLPGTAIRYVRMTEQGAIVLIKGQEALKRTGDSLDWSGSPVPGVSVDLRSRIAWYTEKELHVIGTAKIVVENVAPRAATPPKTALMQYGGPVAYGLARGAFIPGSVLTYDGQTDEGAKVGGLTGYPYRQVGDSIYWEGMLRDKVYIRLDLRVIQFDAKGLRVGGLVNLWIGP